jgi:hypothetical protein
LCCARTRGRPVCSRLKQHQADVRSDGLPSRTALPLQNITIVRQKSSIFRDMTHYGHTRRHIPQENALHRHRRDKYQIREISGQSWQPVISPYPFHCLATSISQYYSKPSLIRLAVHSWVHTLKDTWRLGRQMSHLSVQTNLDSFFKPALSRAETGTASQASIDE